MKFEKSLEFATQLDLEDGLSSFRDQFYFPKGNGKEVIYFNGNSLGLQPKATRKYVDQELIEWAELGVYGHLQAKNPWVTYHKILKEPLASLLGAYPKEVNAMNSLTVNLHLLLVSFYRPSGKKVKILIEKGAFSSDQYAVETQVKFHGLLPDEAIIEIAPEPGAFTITTEEILSTIEQNKDELALIFLGGVNFYTGQAFDMKTITEAGHKAGAVVGYDLAHAAGNIELQLHHWNVDFAVWCSYKYLNSGPGGVGGAFVHERHSKNFELPRFAGWFGHLEEERFKMEKGFKPIEGVDGWQLSNVPILTLAAHKASLDIFTQAGMKNLVEKSRLLTGFLEFLLEELINKYRIFKIITPSRSEERGCQLSLFFENHGERVFHGLGEAGIVVDMRRPSVIRVTPVPLYNSFQEVYQFALILENILLDITQI